MTTKTANPKMVVLARQSRGLTQSQLAAHAGIPQAKVSKVEAGLSEASDELLAAFAKILDYPESFFFQKDELYGFDTSVLFHRKREGIGAKILDRIHALINIQRMHLEKLLEAAEIDSAKKFPSFDIEDFRGRIDQIAQAVRATWVLPRGPVDNVTKAIEDAGGIVIRFDFGTRLIDAISQWIRPRLPPIFFVNKDVPGDRLRWSLAHELGHVVMHSTLNPNIEDEANQFAANFLMPANEIRPHLVQLNPAKLAALKPFWKVAMSALLKRGSDLGTITERNARYIWMQFSAAGYRLREPVELDIATEEPQTLAKLLAFHRESLGYNVSDLASILHEHEHRVRSNYFGQQPLRAVR